MDQLMLHCGDTQCESRLYMSHMNPADLSHVGFREKINFFFF